MADKHVWIAQCLCPDRHCILAAAGEAETAEQAGTDISAPLQDQINALIAAGALNPWCGLCNAPHSDWHYEVGRSRWSTLAEAMPHARAEELKQVITAAVFGDLHKRQRAN